MLIHENHGLSISFIASVSSCHLGRKVCAAGFVFAAVTKLATCGRWLINNENSFYMHVIRYLDSFSLDVLELALELLPLAWAYGPTYFLLCYHGPAYYFVMLFYGPTYYLLCYYGPTYYFAVLLWAYILFCCVTMGLHITLLCYSMVLHIILLCYYGPTYYFAVLLSAYILFCCVTMGLHISLLCYYRPAYYLLCYYRPVCYFVGCCLATKSLTSNNIKWNG